MSDAPKGQVIVISGPSGVGKTSLYKKVLEELKDKLDFSISVTTRTPRQDEKNGEDYIFINEEEFKKMTARGEFAEWAEVHGNFYGTPKTEIDRILASGKSVLLDLDVQGAMKIRDAYAKAKLIYILPPSFEVLERRLYGRNTDDSETRHIRMQNAVNEMKYVSRYHVRITNDDFERAAKELHDTIEKLVSGDESWIEYL
ncbi:MAG: guanylate kinase [Spirochaetes bacterium GWF1_51_8]|nr:MAG: guanylate kinase [Spirochaetes bacterium GWF1_51_8]